jgi:hypothetical protein
MRFLTFFNIFFNNRINRHFNPFFLAKDKRFLTQVADAFLKNETKQTDSKKQNKPTLKKTKKKHSQSYLLFQKTQKKR